MTVRPISRHRSWRDRRLLDGCRVGYGHERTGLVNGVVAPAESWVPDICDGGAADASVISTHTVFWRLYPPSH